MATLKIMASVSMWLRVYMLPRGLGDPQTVYCRVIIVSLNYRAENQNLQYPLIRISVIFNYEVSLGIQTTDE
uniref:Uncharacterized protein n=1 Tax=Lepeophtheirus salmonis TaxID=72036 RepID=A0A0K2U9X4_LEPSM